MKNEKWDDVHGNTTPDDRMVAFLESPTDSYAILQLREDVDDMLSAPMRPFASPMRTGTLKITADM
ncbi:hypothetical protein [Anaeromassilibacillus sp. An250]|uniref:hypothetical protein n=1 Tax=Anaeromassilibacillus sp. An250 TaxID=1965604 RepID=UPI000B39796E|nr:hypothetical protein [Anaeromassilibacillus sp. An250]OUO73682.1 hypothetical protein B5F54_10290 [Anaeromassilibacillus sp. An250]